jgi:hypothetical protein
VRTRTTTRCESCRPGVAQISRFYPCECSGRVGTYLRNRTLIQEHDILSLSKAGPMDPTNSEPDGQTAAAVGLSFNGQIYRKHISLQPIHRHCIVSLPSVTEPWSKSPSASIVPDGSGRRRTLTLDSARHRTDGPPASFQIPLKGIRAPNGILINLHGCWLSQGHRP